MILTDDRTAKERELLDWITYEAGETPQAKRRPQDRPSMEDEARHFGEVLIWMVKFGEAVGEDFGGPSKTPHVQEELNELANWFGVLARTLFHNRRRGTALKMIGSLSRVLETFPQPKGGAA